MKIDVNGTRIHVTQQGQGEITLVFLHYYGGSSRTWDAVANELSSRYHIVAIDHRGWGQSDAPAEGYHISDLAADAESVIKALGLQRFILIGHSMGGKAAQLIASRQPIGLEGLVLVAPSPPSPMLLSDEQRTTLCGAYQTRESIEFVIDNVLTAKPLDTARREQIIEDSLNAAPQAKAAWPNIAMREDITAAVSSINTPTLVISGDQDKVDCIATVQAEVLPRIPHASMHILPGIGHLSPLEAPVEVAQTIGRFVASIQNKSALCSTPEQVPAAFDAALNGGDLDALLGTFSNQATMRMTDGQVVQGPNELRHALAQLLALKPQIRNAVRSVIFSDDLALVLLDWTLNLTLPDGQQHMESGIATQVMDKGRDGGWRLRISNPLGLN